MQVIDIHNLTKDYGEGKGIFDLSFSVSPGEVFGFLGPNGSGKTTTIRHLMGFIRPQQGSCFINGMDCQKEAFRIQKTLGYIPGESAFMEQMTGEEYINFAAKYRNLKDMSRANVLIKRFGLDPGGKIKKMSKGMKQKVSIVCAFMHDPDVLILDEPTSGLDPLMQNEFIDLLLEEKERNKSILMSSHMFEEVEKTCRRVAIIKEGKLMTVDTMENLKASKMKRYFITFFNSEDASAFAEKDFQIESIQGNRVEVLIQSDLNKLLAALPDYSVLDLTEKSQSLEEIFLHYYGGADHD